MKLASIKNLRFVIYLAMVVLVNLASSTLFLRTDLTKNRIYSLSGASKDVVAGLEEPLTIKAFFSKNLPPPYNNTEQQLRDLLEEYAIHANRYFNYTVHSIGSSDDLGAKTKEDREKERMAQNYSIYPIQIQNIEQDEVKLLNAYMGVVFIHGDMIETISSLANTENLEYTLTNTIRKMARKTSALLGMEEDVQLVLYLSSTLYPLVDDLENVPGKVQAMVEDLNVENFGRIHYTHIDPTQSAERAQELQQYNMPALMLQTASGSGEEPAYASLLVSYKGEAVVMNLFVRDFFGYAFRDPASFEGSIQDSLETLIGINEEIGYVVDYGTAALGRSRSQGGQAPPNRLVLNAFERLVSQNYAFKEVRLEQGIPDGLKSLLLVGPREHLSDFALYQLDQFLMKGGSLALFIDTYAEFVPPPPKDGEFPSQYGQQPQQPVYIPIITGMEEMLEHYGITVRKSYVMDEKSFIQRRRLADGGMSEIPFYFAPQIDQDNINKERSFIKGIKSLIMLYISPLEIEKELPDGRSATLLFSSSDRSWEMDKNINLSNPYMITPPQDDVMFSRPLAYLLEGQFTSYFAGKEIPQRERGEQEQNEARQGSIISTEKISGGAKIIEATKTGSLFVIGSSSLLGDNVLDDQGASPNSVFVMNLIDYLSDQEDYAVMRSKGQTINPLRDTQPETRTFIKTFNIVGLPILTVLVGILIWLRWISRKTRIRSLFEAASESRGLRRGKATEEPKK